MRWAAWAGCPGSVSWEGLQVGGLREREREREREWVSEGELG